MLELFGKIKFGEFKPVAWYSTGMGSLIYLNKDCSYTSHRVDNNLDILKDNSTGEVVGVMLHISLDNIEKD